MAMRAPGFIATPFAATGDRTILPSSAQPDGSVSWPTGWTPDYSKDQTTDPNAKPIDRASTNYLMYAMSQLLNRWQTETFPEFIAAEDNGGIAFPYPRGCIVRFGNPMVLRMSMVDNNNTVPSATANTAQWADPFGSGGATSDAVLKNISTVQTMLGGLNLGGASTSPNIARSAIGAQIANASFVTGGAAAASNANASVGATSGYIRFPWWLSSSGRRCYILQYGSGVWQADPSRSFALRLVTFPVSFYYVPTIFVTANGQPNTNGLGTTSVWPNQNTYQFQATLDANATANGPGGNTIANNVPFMWMAIGVADEQIIVGT